MGGAVTKSPELKLGPRKRGGSKVSRPERRLQRRKSKKPDEERGEGRSVGRQELRGWWR